MNELPNNELLSAAELAELTGCNRRTTQIEWLTTHGWVYVLAQSGLPKVSRLYMRSRLGVAVGGAPPLSTPTEPDWGAVR
jgi:hypothetical protein